jgi:hypothetical protein
MDCCLQLGQPSGQVQRGAARIIKAGGMIVEPCSRPERRLPKMRMIRYVAMNSRIAGASFGQLVNRPVSVPAITPIER